MEFSLENMCRACMNEEGSMFSVYATEKSHEVTVNYSEMIMNFTSIQIEKEDGLPKQICQYCLKQLILAYSFKQTIERSDATLREITKNPGIEFIKEEILEEFSDNETPKETNIKTEIISNENVKRDGSDFKLTAEFLDDDFYVGDDETQPVIKEEFIPFEQSVLKPKPRKRNHDDDDYVDYVPKLIKTTRKQYVCPLCSKQFAKFETLKKHKKSHTILKCKLCEKEFRSTHGLRYHMKIHSGVKNYACTFANCEKKFRLKQALDKHLSIHNNEKNHLCPICGKTYAQYDALHYHIRNHTGERPYLCVHCGKTFKQSCHLKNHMWNHTGIKPHKCKSCGKCYTTGHQLKKHLRKYCNNPENQNNVIHFEIEEENVANRDGEDAETNTIFINFD